MGLATYRHPYRHPKTASLFHGNRSSVGGVKCRFPLAVPCVRASSFRQRTTASCSGSERGDTARLHICCTRCLSCEVLVAHRSVGRKTQVEQSATEQVLAREAEGALVCAAMGGPPLKKRLATQLYNQNVGQLFPDRVPNVEVVKALDRLLRRTVGWGLEQYIPLYIPSRLLEGEQTYLVEVKLRSSVMKRLCVTSPGGERRFASTRRFIGPTEVFAQLHMSQDQGGVGWVGSKFLETKLMMTTSPDLFHRVSNDFGLAVGAAGLDRLKKAFRPVGKLYRGAFQTDANYHELLAAVKHLRSAQTPGFVLFQLLVEELAVETGICK
eukprot:2706124-Amphidinium_carterae.1